MGTNEQNMDFFAWYAALLVVVVGLFVGIVSAIINQPQHEEQANCTPSEIVEELQPGQNAATPAAYERSSYRCPPEERVQLDR
ncbi:MAG: hypothetical protein RBU37_20105 [Myxococcota bacterium]|nr:hypothetical protein [Myxococcota bacterium]